MLKSKGDYSQEGLTWSQTRTIPTVVLSVPRHQKSLWNVLNKHFFQVLLRLSLSSKLTMFCRGKQSTFVEGFRGGRIPRLNITAKYTPSLREQMLRLISSFIDFADQFNFNEEPFSVVIIILCSTTTKLLWNVLDKRFHKYFCAAQSNLFSVLQT